MEEQNRPNQSNLDTPSSPEEKKISAENQGKTGLLASVLIVLLILLAIGFIFFRPNPEENTTNENSTSQQTPKVSSPSASSSAR